MSRLLVFDVDIPQMNDMIRARKPLYKSNPTCNCISLSVTMAGMSASVVAGPNSPTPSMVGEDYWDPPCRICKVVDDEANVLCELCNGAYHLACLENIKPPLPRTPEDDEWFCRSCIKRGVPEAILDRTGR